MENISLYSVLLLVHLFGIILGAGGAFVSDGIFFTALKDRIISGDELRILKAGSHFIWVGIILLVISGTGLFLQDIERLSTSAKFISKMTVVLVIVANGVIFHLVHIPFIHGHLGKHYKKKAVIADLIPVLISFRLPAYSGAVPYSVLSYFDLGDCVTIGILALSSQGIDKVQFIVSLSSRKAAS
jgi:uncharacterized membrane protein